MTTIRHVNMRYFGYHGVGCHVVKIHEGFGGTCCLHLQVAYSEDGGRRSLRNLIKLLPDYTVSHLRRQYSSETRTFANVSNLYSRASGFESRPEYQLFYLTFFVIFLIPSRRVSEFLLRVFRNAAPFTSHGYLVTACNYSYVRRFAVTADSLNNVRLFSTNSKILCTWVFLRLRWYSFKTLADIRRFYI
jgi:hypothetical protein